MATVATPTISPGQHGIYLLIIIMIIIIIIIIIIIAILILLIMMIITTIISPDQQHLAPHDGEGARALIIIVTIIVIIITMMVLSPDQQHLAPHDGEGARAQRRPRGQGLLLPPPQHLKRSYSISVYNPNIISLYNIIRI